MVKDVAILFLCEGESEIEFYKILFGMKLPQRVMPIKMKCLKGNFNINAKVTDSIYNFLNQYTQKLYVFVALDRETDDRNCDPPISISLIKKKVSGFGKPFQNRLIDINLITATSDFESWLFHDIEGIWNFLRVTRSRRVNKNKYLNVDRLNNKDMYRIFKQHGKEYRKGERIEGFLNNLNIDIIYNKTGDLREGIEEVIRIMTT